jgi:putative addiction module antidote
MQITLREIGNSLGSIFPKPMIQNLGLKKGDKIDITEEDGKLVIEPIKKPEYSLNELLAQCNNAAPELSDEDKAWLNADPVGKEIL